MKKEDIDTGKLMFDPFDIKTVSKLEYYDEFKEDFGIDKQKVCCYIILVYDLHTQLRKEVPYFNQRKIIGAELAGFSFKKDGHLVENYENILVGKNKQVNAAISKFVRLFASQKYLSLVYYWSIQSAEFENIVSNKESRDYQKTLLNLDKLEKGIEEKTEYLFGGNEVKDIVKALYESVEKENLKIRPEDIAMAENIDELIDSPYGKEYKPEKLKYKSNK